MIDVLVALDALATPFLSPVWRVIAWGCLSASISMALYVKISPQQKIRALKQLQQASRATLMRHDGGFRELNDLIRKDLALSLRQVGLAVIPFLLSLLPLLYLMLYLPQIYPGSLVGFGPGWMQGFEFWYVTALVIASLFIKLIFKIA